MGNCTVDPDYDSKIGKIFKISLYNLIKSLKYILLVYILI